MGFIDQIAITLYQWWAKSLWFKWFWTPFAIGVIPALVVIYYTVPVIRNGIVGWNQDFASFLDTHGLIALLLTSVYPTLLLTLARSIAHRVNHGDVDSLVLLRLIKIVDRVVGCKANRFGKHFASLSKETKEQKQELLTNTFNQITSPEIQIAEIVRGICEFFNSLVINDQTHGDQLPLIEVVLARVENGRIVDVDDFFFPNDEPVQTSLETLNHSESTMRVALRLKRMVLIESTKRELRKKRGRKYKAGEYEDEDSDWSIICYPVQYKPTGTIPFVLSIRSDSKRSFKKSQDWLFKWLLERFESRICLEYSLKLLKREVETYATSEVDF